MLERSAGSEWNSFWHWGTHILQDCNCISFWHTWSWGSYSITGHFLQPFSSGYLSEAFQPAYQIIKYSLDLHLLIFSPIPQYFLCSWTFSFSVLVANHFILLTDIGLQENIKLCICLLTFFVYITFGDQRVNRTFYDDSLYSTSLWCTSWKGSQ